jgi:putative nucleotidyltransferase with HDIG domain
VSRSRPPGSPAHLVARFFDVLTARPLTDDETAWVSERLGPGERAIFFAQHEADRRHGLVSARRVASLRPRRADLVRAALLHDVGKRHARLGVVGRVLASLAMLLHIPIRGRFAVYRDHAVLGGVELRELGCEEVVWRFAACHHGERDPAINPDVWALLEEADGPRTVGKAGIP